VRLAGIEGSIVGVVTGAGGHGTAKLYDVVVPAADKPIPSVT
jgi:hypothetical protein